MSDSLAPIPVEVRDERGGWWPGFLLLGFHADGTVSIRSKKTGAVRRLPQGEWRDPVEERLLAEHAARLNNVVVELPEMAGMAVAP
jgi:hypothetical protein